MMLSIFGGIFLILGIILKLCPPKPINSILGYRSRLSMKNKDTWNEAQKFGAFTSIMVGTICIVAGFIIHKFFPGKEDTISMVFLIIAVICDLVIDEYHLRNVFNKSGERRTV